MSLNHTISRRTVFKGTGAVAAASALGAGAALGVASPAHAAGLEVTNQETDGRMQTYTFSSPSFSGKNPPSNAEVDPRVNVLLPDGYDSGKRYPVLYQFHGGNGTYAEFDNTWKIREVTAGRDLIVVMPDAGLGWHCNPVQSVFGTRNWETFHIEELIPWVDATFRTFPEQAGRAVSGFSMGGFGALKYAAKYSDKFASVSAHSGPANLRSGWAKNLIFLWANITSHFEFGYPVYGRWPWKQDRISADNPIEHVDSYRDKRIFLVAGTDKSESLLTNPNGWFTKERLFKILNEDAVLRTQKEFTDKLDSAGIQYERFEEPGSHFVRHERLQQDIDGIVAHLRKAE